MTSTASRLVAALPGDLGHEVRLYRRLAGAQVRGQMQYRASFWMQLTGVAIVYTVEFASVLFYFLHFETIGGWGPGEVALLYGLSSVSFGIAHTVGGGFAVFSQMIVRGDFDRLLVRPLSAFVQVLAADIQLRRLGSIIQGVVALGIGLAFADVSWSPGMALWLPVTVLSAATVFTALFSLEATLCFWTTQGTEIVNAFTYGGSNMTNYPIHIYDRWVRRFLVFVLPLALVIYVPVVALLGRPVPLGLPGWMAWSAPLAALAFATVAGLAWRVGVRHYRSTGT
ncbi:MAG: ABC-2 family transporter protein [Thermomicrobiales bacterium]